MSRWTRIHDQATGALPAATLTKWGAALIALLLAAFLLTQSVFNGGDAETQTPLAPQQPAGPGSQDQVSARVREENMRQEQRRRAAERTMRQQRSGGVAGGRVTAAEFQTAGGGAITAASEGEAELREALRLEEIERRRRSLRSLPVAQSYRPSKQAGTAVAEQAEPAPASPRSASIDAATDQMNQTLASVQQSLAELEAEAAAGQPLPAPSPTTPLTAQATSGAPGDPVKVSQPSDPPGWERIYEGSFLEAVLVTQLSGDFPGPVLASVSVPFYSADRQRILVPRGSRVIGTAAAVGGQDQSRLAVGFHRLLFPDGRWVSLEFHGLNQVGEGALKDRVNRHYVSMFAAVGAVGVLSGLTLQGSNPYAGGQAGFRAGAGQGLGQAAMQILNRFLNRLPTITIRAGHRLRVWFTSDVLVPRPQGA